ncbi:dienelactone hydrolase family protein [Nocardia sp. CA2R105]|uniref:dienelactone hydrolase family protein n=1 Tax=Nocardia coffeae TaxID=2873381 RepID=UPI001CA600AE|nr:dienelactone hydrolase family protein [Nocardia coffeae]MBY8863919.1 dienelactone hydrolase family protein [Nocardia coffeae]
MTAVHGVSVDIQTPDGVADAYVAHPDDGAAHPGVIVYQDAFGLRPALRAVADRIASHGYTVLVPNAFYRAGRAPLFDLPDPIDLKSRPEIFEKIRPQMQALTPEVVKSDSAAYLDWMAASELVSDGPVGLTGYCMGGRLVLFTAAAHPERVAAGGCFHTGGLVTDGPDSTHLMVEPITAELFFGYADNDQGATPAQIETFGKALDAAGVTHTSEVYEGSIHGYTQADTEAYSAEAAERHYRDLLALLDRTLGSK